MIKKIRHRLKATGVIGKILIFMVMLAIIYITVQNILTFKDGMDNVCNFGYKFPFLKVDLESCMNDI